MTYSPNFRGNAARGSSRQLISGYVNGSGALLTKARPVTLNASGQIVGVDVSDIVSVKSMVGLTAEDIPNAATGSVIDAGRLEEVVISYPVNTPVYMSKTGFLTDQIPAVGANGFAEGDFVIFVGVIVKNEFNPANKDIKLMLTVVGQL